MLEDILELMICFGLLLRSHLPLFSEFSQAKSIISTENHVIGTFT